MTKRSTLSYSIDLLEQSISRLKFLMEEHYRLSQSHKIEHDKKVKQRETLINELEQVREED